MYYLQLGPESRDAHGARAFACAELMLIPEDTQMVPEGAAQWQQTDVFLVILREIMKNKF